MSEQEAKALLDKYLNGECTPEEAAIVESWYHKFSGEQSLPQITVNEDREQANMLASLLEQRAAATANVRSLWPRISVAASIVICAAAGIYFLNRSPSFAPITVQQTRLIKTGGNKALLTLANGSQVTLNNTADTILHKQGGADVTNTSTGQLLYNTNAGADNGPQLSYNTLATPRGGQYQVTLADGSHVWLNAASSLKFPTVFSGDTREVELTGEAYFEVAHIEGKPFKVITARQTIEVLGTHFDVNAYADENAACTTLLQGSVRLNNEVTIKPGQQGTTIGTKTDVTATNTDDVIAWKDGKFSFANEHITQLMRKIARWYDVEVVYEGDVNGLTFSGSMSRFDRIEKLLNILQSTRTVHFKIEGRRITVMN